MAETPDDADRPDESNADDGGESTEFELERAYDRADLAAVFREFATAFENGRPVRMDSDDRTAHIAVPERVVAEFEAERDAAAEPPVGELELELEWDDPDGTSVRVSDREPDESGTGQARAEGEDEGEDEHRDVDPAAAVMPLERMADQGGREGEAAAGADETAATDADSGAEAEAETETEPGEPAETGRTSRFEVYEDRAGQWRWRLVHWNGNIVADSGEGYASRSNAERAARSVMRSAPTATIERKARDE
ncbi:amphi-Trp domain-containing protein [Natrinema salifodinae]|uniref:Amphi-Trp domain-containing protein n=1 Tax=Natrinema salifodinae TaxID=1202768 RepID=A0A1I0Q3S1_9EURY|nr:amphi-Trp domain-containing protein [Natrinema salifodinae]SEW21540.1 amphi-Trp domain-containing protein [Natrinema salifodinae]